MPIIPLHIQKALADYEARKDSNVHVGEVSAEVGDAHSYRAQAKQALGRAAGALTFRRYADGSLDFEDCLNRVLDILQQIKHKDLYLTDHDKIVLTAVFPGVFHFMDPAVAVRMAHIHAAINPMEAMQIASLVAAHIAEEINWNAGNGGGSVPGRGVTVA